MLTLTREEFREAVDYRVALLWLAEVLLDSQETPSLPIRLGAVGTVRECRDLVKWEIRELRTMAGMLGA